MLIVCFFRRKLIDESEHYAKKLEAEIQLRAVLQDANDRLQVPSLLEFTRYLISIKGRFRKSVQQCRC